MAKQTANAHPKVIRSQSPAPRSAVLGLIVRPDPINAQSIATTPSPKQIRMNVPKNSAHRSPAVPLCHAAGLAGAVSATATYPPLRKRFGSHNDSPTRDRFLGHGGDVAGHRGSPR